jgi:hypothetical protein
VRFDAVVEVWVAGRGSNRLTWQELYQVLLTPLKENMYHRMAIVYEGLEFVPKHQKQLGDHNQFHQPAHHGSSMSETKL